jgi:hypothetical protein
MVAASEKAYRLCCASPPVIAACTIHTPHSSGVARLASGTFREAANTGMILKACRDILTGTYWNGFKM